MDIATKIDIYSKSDVLLVSCVRVTNGLSGMVVENGRASKAAMETSNGNRHLGRVACYGGGGELNLDSLDLAVNDVVVVDRAAFNLDGEWQPIPFREPRSPTELGIYNTPVTTP